MRLRKLITEEKVFLSIHGLLFIWNAFLSIPVIPMFMKHNMGKSLTQFILVIIIVLILMITYQTTGYIHSSSTGLLIAMIIGNFLFLIYPLNLFILFIVIAIMQGIYITRYLRYGTSDKVEIEKRMEAKISEEDRQQITDEINKELYD